MPLWDEELKDQCRKLKPIIGDLADSLYLSYAMAKTSDAKQRFASYIQAYVAHHLSGKVDDISILLPPPQKSAATGEILLGEVIYQKKPLFDLRLRRENFQKHIAICGITGSGKTNLSQLMAIGLMEIDVPFLIVDWKRSYRDLTSLPYHKISTLRVFTVGRKSASPLSWNPLRPPPGVHVQTWISAVAEALEKSHIAGQGVADILMDILDKLFEKEGFYDDTATKFPNFYDARELVERLHLRGRKMLWQDSCSRILRTFTFGPAAGAFNARHPFPLETLLDFPAIIELDQELPKPLRVFMSEVLLRWIHLYRLGQGETDSLRHVTFLEEAHNLFPKTQMEKNASNSVETVFREIRGFGEGLVNITQHPSLMPIYVLGNCNTQIYLGLQHEDDIVTAKRALFLNRGEEVYLDRLKVGEGIVKIKGRIDPCYVRFHEVPIVKGNITDSDLPKWDGGNAPHSENAPQEADIDDTQKASLD